MLNNITKSTALSAAILISSVLFGQSKISTPPNFNNPFNQKTAKASSQVIRPIDNKSIKEAKTIELSNGSFHHKPKNETVESLIGNINTLLSLNSDHTFKLISERTDELGITHTNFHQYYNNFQVDGAMLMVHSRNGIVNSINGQIVEINDLNTIINISRSKAKELAKKELEVTKLIRDYPIETMITKIPNNEGSEVYLAHKVRIDSYSPFVMSNVFVDVKTGEILNKVSLIAHADVTGTGQTMYSGSQSITCDSYSGGFRLRESSRNIETYDATFATGFDTINYTGFTGVSDFTSPTSTFLGLPILSSFSISTLSQSWWYNFFTDQDPDLFINIKDSSGQSVYTSSYISDQNVPLSFSSINLIMTDPPYVIELWDYDAAGGHDFGGSYNVSNTTSGTYNWSGNGNSGSLSISNSGHPAVDVHWGMEQTYDFYLNVFNRDSYDDSGSTIRQFINPPTLQQAYNNNPNNASAYPPPYNFMQYGMGDGQLLNPVVSLDVEGHEFTHMVVGNNGNGGLIYQGESGALNESFSDIFGTCIEFYSGVNPDWEIGEDIGVSAPNMRSMSNPNNPSGLSQQPDTYNGNYWANPTNVSIDDGGVHINSGVQNYWFYLLSQGGSGTNDLQNAYSVTGIGITDARQIAYRNLIHYLGPNATYMDAYNGSLQAAEDLFGNPSPQYTAVRSAWYAVGIGNDPLFYCSGVTNLTSATGTITDGSGSANYNDNTNCKWVITPPGAEQIHLTFTNFDTEAGYDTVFVYDGPNEFYPVIAVWWGDSIPPTISTSQGVGAMTIRFVSDIMVNDSGWTANYTSTGITPTCDGGNVLSSPSGTFSDGSGTLDYGNNQLCYWYIAPPCANSISLSFSQFDTELNYDGVIVYDGWLGMNQLAVYSGSSMPPTVTSNTGEMLVIFTSDHMASESGFNASYTSTGSAHCAGSTVLNTLDYGTISDGSGTNNYCNNIDCSWLIQPLQATSITLDFTAFDLEAASTDGQTIYDAVEVYDGPTTSDSLLGVFAGNNIPPAITSSGGSMLVRFYSDMAGNYAGWEANFTSTQSPFCSDTTTLTASNGSFSDGSATDQYTNNSNCSWLIQPPNANSITLSFSAFDTELNYDGVIVYDGPNSSSTVLGQFSGNTIPTSVTSSGGSMFVEFLSDVALRKNGWTANYSSIITGLNEINLNNHIEISPNPSNGVFRINFTIENTAKVEIMDILGQDVYHKQTISKGLNNINATHLSKGIYLIRIKMEDDLEYVDKLLIK